MRIFFVVLGLSVAIAAGVLAASVVYARAEAYYMPLGAIGLALVSQSILKVAELMKSPSNRLPGSSQQW